MNFRKLNTPITISYEDDFRSQVSSFLEEYKRFIIPVIQELKIKGEINDQSEYHTINRINKSTDLLNEFFVNFDLGDRLKCYRLLKKLMIIYETCINNPNFTYPLKKNNSFYRIRSNNIEDGKHKHNIFHIPFNLRHLVTNQRFNPPGLPCLYCSSNFETCAMESGENFRLYESINHPENNYDALNVGIFKNSIEVNCLDLSLRDFERLHNNVTTNNLEFLNYCIISPFIILLHCKQNFDNEQTVSFRMEYTLPSFLMSWIFNQIGEGFRYFYGKSIEAFKYSSIKSTNPLESANFVFPSHYSYNKKYCKVLECIISSKVYH